MAKTNYTKEVQKKADDYITDTNWCSGEAQADVIPSTARLAIHLGVARKTLYNWGEAFPDFLHTLEKIQALQEVLLLNRGLAGTFNSNIVKLALGNHGYMEKTATEVSFDGENKEKAEKLVKNYLADKATD